MATSFLDLPRELRDSVLKLIISSPATDRPSTKDEQSLLEARTELLKPSLEVRTGGYWVKYLPLARKNNVCVLSLVSRQIRRETLEVLARYRNRHVYILDLVLLNEVELLPTWINVPRLTDDVDRLEIALRIVGNYNPEKYRTYHPLRHYRGFCDAGDASPAMLWVLCSVIERFLCVGPNTDEHNIRPLDKIRITTLAIDVRIPSGIRSERFGDAQSCERPSAQDLYGPLDGVLQPDDRPIYNREHVLDPTYLFNFIKYQFEWLLDLAHGSDEYGALFYEHIGRVVLMYDGEEREVVDLGQRLNDLKHIDLFYRNPTEFKELVDSIKEKRKRLGLSILED